MEIGFIDYSKDERNKILSTLKLLGEQTALDELGIGVIRDAYADLLFPGVSTLQTRAKYFVIIPYLFQEAFELAEKGKLCSGREMMQWLHTTEDKLVETLVHNSGSGANGIIGSVALKQKRSVKMRPSAIYWSGLRTFGILRNEHLSLSAACAATVQIAKKKSEAELKKDGESFDDLTAANVGTTLFLPLHPDSLWEKNAQIVLTGKEAAFLESCITRSVMTRDSLLAFLIKNRTVCNSFADIPVNILPPHLQRDYLLAYEFSHFIYGAHVRYNVIYSNGTDEAMTSEFHTWRREFLQEPFDLEPILERVASNQALTSFCRSFLDAVNHNDLAAMDDLIVNRELQVKGVRAKLRKPGEYQYDPCRPIHFYPLDFRFNRANVIIQDILTGLEAERDV